MEFDQEKYLKRQALKDKKKNQNHRRITKLENLLEWNEPERKRFDSDEEYKQALKRWNDSINTFNAILNRYSNLAIATVRYNNIKDKLISHKIKEIIEDENEPDIVILVRSE